MIFLTYAASAFVAYALLSPLYFFEIRQNGIGRSELESVMKRNMMNVLLLCTVKALDWGLYMELDESWGPMIAAIVNAIVFYGFQEWVDRRIKGQAVVFSVKLWKRSFFGLTNILDGWIHLALFHYLQTVLPETATCVAVAGATGHVAGLLSTYPFVSMRRQNKRYFEGFWLYFVRSTVAAFLIPFFASFYFNN